MPFRLKAFTFHLASSAIILTVTLGSLYLGWYHWPGWYLADSAKVTLVMAGVDVIVGPLLTLVVANERKPRRELARDIGMIGILQLAAFLYGSISLWNGRPLYYAYSVNSIAIVQAYDIDPAEAQKARAQNTELAPHWYSLPRWIYAPLPQDSGESSKIMESAISGGVDVTGLPLHYQRWDAGRNDLRSQLKPVAQVKFFDDKQRRSFEEQMTSLGLRSEQANALALTGRGAPLLAVFDVAGTRLITILKVK